ncbi:MAG: zinc ribbon domain-containing protein [Lachnospiraceae bacterium]|nr:zinc ribbon domain-containing protein [Lachnospiraceae bacterium]
MAFCINCGKQLPDGSKFCLNCGTPVPTVPEPAPEIKPEPVPEPAPVVEPIPEPIPEPAPQPAPAPEPPKAPKASLQGGGSRKVLIFAAGVLAVLVIIGVIVGLVLKFAGGSSKKAEGTGTALTELLDDAARTYYAGGASSESSSKPSAKDAATGEDGNAGDTENAGETGNAGSAKSDAKTSTTLHQGWYYADYPAGYEPFSEEENSFSDGTGKHQISAEITYRTSSEPDAAAKAQAEVDMWNGERQLGPVLDLGGYEWHTVLYDAAGKPITFAYADATDEVVAYFIAEGLAVDDQELLDLLASFKAVDDPESARDKYLSQFD